MSIPWSARTESAALAAGQREIGKNEDSVQMRLAQMARPLSQVIRHEAEVPVSALVMPSRSRTLQANQAAEVFQRPSGWRTPNKAADENLVNHRA
jgi:hypothetical protein